MIQAGPESLGGATTQAVALGGATDGDAVATAKLGNLYRDSSHETVRETALVNLGNVSDLRTLLAETGAKIAPKITSQDAALRQGNLFGAVHNVLMRHPEDIEAALGLYRQALETLDPSAPLGRELIASVFSSLTDLKFEESRELLESLAASGKPVVADHARYALKKLDER